MEVNIELHGKSKNEDLLNKHLTYIRKMLKTVKANKVEISTTVIYDDIAKRRMFEYAKANYSYDDCKL